MSDLLISTSGYDYPVLKARFLYPMYQSWKRWFLTKKKKKAKFLINSSKFTTKFFTMNNLENKQMRKKLTGKFQPQAQFLQNQVSRSQSKYLSKSLTSSSLEVLLRKSHRYQFCLFLGVFSAQAGCFQHLLYILAPP